MSLSIKNLSVSVEETEIIHELSLEIQKGEVHVIMGPNGSGKSSLANALMGHPSYTVSGSVMLDGIEITELSPEDRARAGLFLSMQYPPEIAGVSMVNFLRTAIEEKTGEKQKPVPFFKKTEELLETLGMDKDFAQRSLNAGFSGGEKKRAEIVQLLALNPTYAILDETDSGLDVDGLSIVAKGIERFRSKEHGILLITHYNRLPSLVVPDMVHIMVNGKIVKSGGAGLAKQVEHSGYKEYVIE